MWSHSLMRMRTVDWGEPESARQGRAQLDTWPVLGVMEGCQGAPDNPK
jgi:hypothetical protein